MTKPLSDCARAARSFGVPAAGKHTETRGMSTLTFKDGKIVAQHDLWDAAAIFRQLGVIA